LSQGREFEQLATAAISLLEALATVSINRRASLLGASLRYQDKFVVSHEVSIVASAFF